jgi:hypothetical protein
VTEQEPTAIVSTVSIMMRDNFQQGVDDVRLGRPARFDELDDDFWAYERGRQFAMVAPISMQVWIGNKINPKAMRLYRAAKKRGIIL